MQLGYLPTILTSHALPYIDKFEFQYKCIAEKLLLPFSKRPAQKHMLICLLKYIIP